MPCSAVSDSFGLRELSPTRLLCPWDPPGKNNKMGCHSLLQEMFLTQGSNPPLLHFLHCKADSLPAEPSRKPWQLVYCLFNQWSFEPPLRASHYSRLWGYSRRSCLGEHHSAGEATAETGLRSRYVCARWCVNWEERKMRQRKGVGWERMWNSYKVREWLWALSLAWRLEGSEAWALQKLGKESSRRKE